MCEFPSCQLPFDFFWLFGNLIGITRLQCEIASNNDGNDVVFCLITNSQYENYENGGCECGANPFCDSQFSPFRRTLDEIKCNENGMNF